MMLKDYRIACYLFLLLILGACGSEHVEEQRPFEQYDYFDFAQEIERLDQLNPMVEKTVIAEGKRETQTDTISWSKELSWFKGSDINHIRNKDRYSITIDEDPGTKIRTITYRAKDEQLPVQLMSQTFDGANCTKVLIQRGLSTTMQESMQELVYEPDRGYYIVAKQKVQMAFETDFEVKGHILHGSSSRWRSTLDLGDATLPFNFELWSLTEDPKMVIINGDERIWVEDVVLNGDSIFISMPVFLSGFKGRIVSGDRIEGNWHNRAKGPDYIVPWTATKGWHKRFAAAKVPENYDGKWEVVFGKDTEDEFKALGYFNQNGTGVTGTFMTETGDFRFLEGSAAGDSLLLSTFDGSHAFLFKAALNDKDELEGTFWSGTHWKQDWMAHRNANFELAHPDSLTYLKPGYDSFDFSVADRNGKQVSLQDSRFDDKVTIIQIIGSWCPNCMDETAYLSELHKGYRDQGLEVLALCFEKTTDGEANYAAIDKLAHHFDAEYDFLLAGKASKSEASDMFPMLNKIISFPTTIFIDRKGNVRKIHTGFYGPGTGEYYTEYVSSTTQFVEKLLREKSL